jgi:NAD(P)-dependent dehydrogenase (short-subunit alcohol dehydrogenase family)
MGKLDGKVAIVTGPARGLGRAYAKRLAGLGERVAVADLNLHSYEEFEAEAKAMTGESTVADIEASGGSALGVEVDVTDHTAVAGMVARVVAMPNGHCRIHGGKSPGAPRGERNGRWRGGFHTPEARAERGRLRALIRQMRETMDELP